MPYHAQSLACYLLSYFVRINEEECESVEIILGLIPMFNCSTEIDFVAPRTRSLCRRLLPQLKELASRHNPVYSVQKPYYMINIAAMLTTIIRPLVSHQSSYERSELHSTISAAYDFLRSELTNIRTVVAKWIRANPNGLATSPRHHIGSWEYSIKPVARPTARMVIPPSDPPTRVYIRTHQLRRSATYSRRRTSRTMSTISQESKIADILEALELVEPQAGRTRSDSESSCSDSSCVSTPGKDDLDSHFDYAALGCKHPVL
ncbi:unnamed protein product [Rhizoctonia solani]|uniref:Uncharacterized protein n=1 Tax=Rhizoctonia solani TaxID=456999 RepID=A0A8H3H1B0_9AGAM|nr:unnamed protein product [Rhizoctonia solani]